MLAMCRDLCISLKKIKNIKNKILLVGEEDDINSEKV